MSRLVIKNLPEGVTEDKIRSIFGEKGMITDIQLKYTKEGKFRRFGFVGYKTEEEASAAQKALEKIYIDSNKITVQLCANLGDPSKPKSWSKYASDSTRGSKDTKNKIKENIPISKENNTNKTKEIKEIIKKHKDDPLFNEYLESHLKGDKQNTKLLQKLKSDGEDHESDNENDDNHNKNSDAHQDADDVQKEDDLATKAISDKDYMELLKKKAKGETVVVKENVEKKHKKEFFTVKLKGLAYNHKKKDIKNFFKGIQVKSIRVPQKIKGIAYAGFKTEKLMKNALNKNRSFLDGKQITVTVYTKKNEEDKPEDTSNPRWKQQEDTLKNEESIGESGRIFLRNLSYTTTEDEIRKIFEKYGQLTEVNLPVDTTTRKIKGFGTVTFLFPEHAVKAYSELDGTVHCGRLLHLLPAKAATSVLDLLNQDGLTFQQKKELQQKAQAYSSHNWNTLFLGQNAVADAVANAYGTTKEKVLDDDSGTSMAVRLALGETQLVQETQKFLEENGVKLTAFNQAPKERSKTVILVKNLPAGTQVQEIERLFAQYGEIGRVILPPSGITALVEFFEPYEARKAFKKLAYSRFKHMPLYLEWAPNESFVDNTPKKVDNNVKVNEEEIKKETEKAIEEEEESDEEEDQPEPDTTLFVKNLNFNTTNEVLKKHFEKCGKLHYATVSMKKDPNDPANKLSMGYGFVRYKLKSDTDRALKELQFSLLDGKTLELKLSERMLPSDAKSVKKTANVTEQTGTKILVRNVPFQANADEVKDLFKVFGELKAVRLPKKMVGDVRHRGFGFVEFYTKKEAKRAFKALCQSTHLYGRRLVLEWAQTEENVEDLRKRTAKHFHDEGTSTKKSKKSTLNAEDIGLAE